MWWLTCISDQTSSSNPVAEQWWWRGQMRQWPSVIDTPAGRLRYDWRLNTHTLQQRNKGIKAAITKGHCFMICYLAPDSHYQVLLQLRIAETVMAFVHGGRQPPTLPDGFVPHPLLLSPLALPLRRTWHKHVIQRIVVAIRLSHHLGSQREWGQQRRWRGEKNREAGEENQRETVRSV